MTFKNVVKKGDPPRGKGVEARAGSEFKLLSSSILRGCNVYHGASVIRQEVELGAITGAHSGQAGPGFAARFVDRFGGFKTLNPGGVLPVAFVDRLNSAEGAPMVEVLFQAILAVEASMAAVLCRLGAIEFSEIMAAPSPATLPRQASPGGPGYGAP